VSFFLTCLSDTVLRSQQQSPKVKPSPKEQVKSFQKAYLSSYRFVMVCGRLLRKGVFSVFAVYSFGHTFWIQFYSHGFFFEKWTDACNMCDNFGCGFHCVSKEVCQDGDLWNWTGRYINHHPFLLFSILDKIPVRSFKGIAVPSTWCQTQTQQLG
jgi:hypothetical protein